MLSDLTVMRDGWVAYLCELNESYTMDVMITIIGDHPADLYLFEGVHFQTYKNNPQVTFVPFEAKGYQQGVTGEFTYKYVARETGRYYVIIDNKDWPMGTPSSGPVDYTITIAPKWDVTDDVFIPAWTVLATLTAIGLAAVVTVRFRNN